MGALFPIVNPLGNTPIFLTLTRGLSGQGRTKLARAIAVNGLVLMVVSIFIGTHMYSGSSGFRSRWYKWAAGWWWSLPGGHYCASPITMTAAEDAKRPRNEANYMRQAFYPLTLPLTVGPGSIAVAITVGANRTEGSEWRWPLIAGLLIGALMIAISIYLSYRFAERIARRCWVRLRWMWSSACRRSSSCVSVCRSLGTD